MWIQVLWCFSILAATWFCFEGARFDRTPLRVLAFIAVAIGVLHGFHELMQLSLVMQGRSIDQQVGYEVLVPFILMATKYFHLVRTYG